MFALTSPDFNTAYPEMIHGVLRQGIEVGPRGTRCKEVHPAAIEILAPRRRLVTSSGRPINVAFALAEVLWILQGREDVEMLAFYNSNISQFSDDGETFNAAYGARLRSSFGHDQIADIIRTLQDDRDSRQATLVLSLPARDRGWDAVPSHNGGVGDVNWTKHVTKDRACNVLAHVMIREGRLDWLQIVRSNDSLWGTPYNWMQFTHLQEYIASLLGVPVGKYTHVVDSLHIYDYHYEEAQAIRPFDLYDAVGGFEHSTMNSTAEALHHLQSAEEDLRTGADEIVDTSSVFGDYWQAVWHIWVAHSHYREGRDEAALDSLLASDDLVYRAAQARFYWHWRWGKDPAKYGTIEERLRKQYEAQPFVLHWILTS